MKLRPLFVFVAGLLALGAGRSASAGPKVLVCFGDAPFNGMAVVSMLQQSNAFDSVTGLDCGQSTPTLATLMQYQAVLMWDNFPYSDRTGLGNVMADYVDAGGGVVQGMFDLFANFELQGRWSMGPYNCIEPTPNDQSDSLKPQPNDPNSDLVQGVMALTVMNAGQSKLAAGATSVWDYAQSGAPAIATCAPNGHARVDLNFYPYNGNWKGDGSNLLRNALVHVAGGFNPLKPTPSPVSFPDTGTGAVSLPLTVTYTNSSKMSQTVTSLAISGPQAAEFAIGSQPMLPLTVPAGGTFTVSVSFAPSGVGPRSAKLSAMVTGQMGNADASLLGNGVASKIIVTPSPVDFGGTQLGSTVTKTVTIGNAGAGKISITSLLASDPSVFSILTAPDLPVVVSSGGSFTVSMQFKPAVGGLTKGTLTIVSNAPNTPSLTIPISGYSGPAMVQIGVGSLLFENVNLGARSQEQKISVSNSGYSPLTLKGAQLSGAEPGQFALNLPMLPVQIPALSSATVGLSFVPTSVGLHQATVIITTDDANQPSVTVKAFGSGTQTTAMLSAKSFDFGTVRVGMASTPQVLAITSTGNGTVKVPSITITGNDAAAFSILSGAPPFQVLGGQTSKVGFGCKPVQNGSLAATATVVTDLGSQMVQLTCKGSSPRTVVTPNQMDFGAVKVNEISAKLPFTITNSGTDDLNVMSFDLSGADSVSFEIVDLPGQLPVVVTAGQMLTVNLVFKPTTAGAHDAVLKLSTDDPLLPSPVIPLTGTAIQAGISIKPVAVNFGPVGVGTTTMPTAITITNTGDVTLGGVMAALTGMNATLFSVDQRGPFTIAPGQSIGLGVTFSPIAAGMARATLAIAVTGLATTSVTLNGSGLSPMIAVTLPAMMTALSFGSVNVGATSSPLSVGLKNTGTAAVTLGAVTSSDPAFVVDTSGSTLTLMPNASTTFAVTFRPSAGVSSRGLIAVTLPNVKTPIATVNADGNGVAPPRMMTGCAAANPHAGGAAWPLGLMLFSGMLVARRRRHH